MISKYDMFLDQQPLWTWNNSLNINNWNNNNILGMKKILRLGLGI